VENSYSTCNKALSNDVHAKLETFFCLKINIEDKHSNSKRMMKLKPQAHNNKDAPQDFLEKSHMYGLGIIFCS
jgi:hypothetical protein